MINDRLKSIDPFYALAIIVALLLISLFAGAFWVGVKPTPPPKEPEELQTTLPALPLPLNTSELSQTSTMTPASIPTDSATEFIPNTPTSTYAPPPTATPLPVGFVIVASLNIRAGPGMEYRIIGTVYKEDEVKLLGRDVPGDWLSIEGPDGQTGWVAAQHISTSTNPGDLQVLSVAPSEVAKKSSLRDLDSILQLGVNQELSIKESLAGFQEHWYTFTELDPETAITFMFRPNINFEVDHFSGYKVQFFLYDQNQIPQWPPGDAESLPNIGAGVYGGVDRDGELGTGELVWRGGPLVPGTRYYLRFVNRSQQTIEYCLVPQDVYSWMCR